MSTRLIVIKKVYYYFFVISVGITSSLCFLHWSNKIEKDIKKQNDGKTTQKVTETQRNKMIIFYLNDKKKNVKKKKLWETKKILLVGISGRENIPLMIRAIV